MTLVLVCASTHWPIMISQLMATFTQIIQTCAGLLYTCIIMMQHAWHLGVHTLHTALLEVQVGGQLKERPWVIGGVLTHQWERSTSRQEPLLWSCSSPHQLLWPATFTSIMQYHRRTHMNTLSLRWHVILHTIYVFSNHVLHWEHNVYKYSVFGGMLATVYIIRTCTL